MEKEEVLRVIEEAARNEQTRLSLSYNQLKTLPAEIGELKNLTSLDLSRNQLTSLPAEIVDLKNLTELYLSWNQLTSLPAEIGELKNLTSLDLFNNQLTALPAEIGELKNLTKLDLSFNKLTKVPVEIGELKNLTKLYLSDNQLTSLPAEIVELKNLTSLDLSNNQLTSLPAEIGELTNLTSLYLPYNQLKTLPAEIAKLKNLTKLDLSRNKLKTLPAEIVELKSLTVLYLTKNPLESPPLEIAEQGIEAIFEYLKQLPEEAIEHNEAKMILVGQGDVGKTCLAKRLIYNKFIEDKSTEGIDILKWDITAPTADEEEIKLNVWDFGGQEIYHATHQFFLTKRSLYLLVWNARKSQDFEHIYYWLHTIEAFGEDSPIVLVLSKRNERDDDLNMKELREKFPQIIGLYKIDSKDGKGIPALKDIIRETAWHLPHMRTPWIASWYNVRKRLERDGRNWIGYEEFKQICQSEGLNNKQTDILDEYLHDLGVIIHFRDRLELRNMVILKPEWATKAVYKILGTHSILDRGGILLHSELDQIWDTDIYPQDIFSKLLGLMNKFELAYELPDKNSHLVAELLPKTDPEFEWDETNNLRFYYHYDFLPAGVITRVIVLMHEDLENRQDGTHLCWREGAVLQREDTRALVKVKPLEKLIEIKINGRKKRELLAIIRNQFDHINRSIKKVKITEEIPCNCSEGCPHKFDYIQLLNAENKGKVTVDCPESWEEVQLPLLLDGYKMQEAKYKYQVALSFAGEDRAHAEKLAKLLKDRHISVFYDSYEQAELWGKDLYQHFQSVYRDKAQYCVVFLSQSYAQKLWTRHELKQAQARAFRENKEYILPVRIDKTEIPGINETIGYIDLRLTPVEEIADLLVEKLSS
jgi:small GTP-binding protein